MSRTARVEVHASRDALADAAAALIAGALADAVAARNRATAVLTGGSTPGPVYDRLAVTPIDWRRVTLTLSDERWVAANDEHSNERLVRTRLLAGLAAPASFVPLKYPSPDVETGARAAAEAVREVFPTDLVLLGMGEDGHIASLFPGDPILPAAMEPAAPLCVSVPISPTEPRLPRISLTFRALLDTRLVVLLITGEAKRALVERVLRDADFALPVAAVLRQPHVPVRILWAA